MHSFIPLVVIWVLLFGFTNLVQAEKFKPMIIFLREDQYLACQPGTHLEYQLREESINNNTFIIKVPWIAKCLKNTSPKQGLNNNQYNNLVFLKLLSEGKKGYLGDERQIFYPESNSYFYKKNGLLFVTDNPYIFKK